MRGDRSGGRGNDHVVPDGRNLGPVKPNALVALSRVPPTRDEGCRMVQP